MDRYWLYFEIKLLCLIESKSVFYVFQVELTLGLIYVHIGTGRPLNSMGFCCSQGMEFDGGKIFSRTAKDPSREGIRSDSTCGNLSI